MFGAGISKPAGFPLASEMMADLRTHLEETLVDQNEGLAEFWDAMVRKGIFRTGDNAELNFTRLQVHTRGILSAVSAGRRVRLDNSLTLFESLPRIINDRFVNRHLNWREIQADGSICGISFAATCSRATASSL